MFCAYTAFTGPLVLWLYLLGYEKGCWSREVLRSQQHAEIARYSTFDDIQKRAELEIWVVSRYCLINLKSASCLV